jgi:outer membrane protein assembly factor BamB
MHPRPLLAILASTLVATSILAATGDIPQWRGPNRDGIFPDHDLLKTWPAGGPALAWKTTKLGKGMSSVSIADGKIFTTAGRKGGQFIVALDETTHDELWAAKISAESDEPRCTPTIDGPLVYAVSSVGDLVCVEAGTGHEVWRKNFATDFGKAQTPTWKFSESPLIDGDKLIVVPGSAEAIVAALDKKTGATIWKCAADLPGKGHEGAGYTGVVLSKAAGIPQYVTLVGKGAIGVDAKTGKLLWHYNRVANGTAVIPTPLVWDDYVFVSSGYGTGAALLKIVQDAGVPANAPAAPKVDEAAVATLTKSLAGSKSDLEAARAARAKTERDSADYETADKRVQSLKGDVAKAESALRKAKGVTDDEAASGKIPGSPVTAEEQYWLNAGVFQNHHGGMVRLGDYIYAGKGHNNGFPICLEWKTGKVVWEEKRGPGKESAAVIAADGNLYFRYQDGIMALIEATPAGYMEKGTFKLASVNGPSWPHPAIHDGKLYIRDQDVLLCYDLRK